MKIRNYPFTIAGGIGILALVIAIFSLSSQASKNHQAIEKGCILLNNAIIQSSQAQNDPNGPTVPLLEGILKVIPPKYAKEYNERVAKQITVLPLIKCHELADHPEDIHPVQTQPAKVHVNRRSHNGK